MSEKQIQAQPQPFTVESTQSARRSKPLSRREAERLEDLQTKHQRRWSEDESRQRITD